MIYATYTVLVSWLQNIFLVVERDPRYSELAMLYINCDQFPEYMLPISVDSTPVKPGLRNLHRDAVPNGAVNIAKQALGAFHVLEYSNDHLPNFLTEGARLKPSRAVDAPLCARKVGPFCWYNTRWTWI